MKESLFQFDDEPSEDAAQEDAGDAVPGTPAVPPGEAVSETAVETAAAPAPAAEPSPAPVQLSAPPPPPANGSFGAYLRDLRLRNRLTIDRIARETKIGTGYIDAIEREAYHELPPPVYVLAYVKMLCAFYRLDDASVDLLTGELRQRLEIESLPPENPDKLVIDLEESRENPILLKKIMLLGGLGVVVLVALITTLVLVFAAPHKKNPDVSVSSAGGAPALLEERQLIDIQPQPKLEVHVLPPRDR